MFILTDLHALLMARPFVPFRLHLSDGGAVDVRHQELVLPGRRYAVIAVPEAAAPEAAFDRHIIVWYMHVTRTELLDPSAPPFSAPPDATGSSAPSAV